MPIERVDRLGESQEATGGKKRIWCVFLSCLLLKVCGQLVDSSLFLVLVRKLVFVLLVVPLGCAASSPLQWDHSKDESLANLQQVFGCI